MSKPQQFSFRGKGAEFYRHQAETQGIADDFEAAIRWAKRQGLRSTGAAINFCRALFPDRYNQWMEKRARPVSLGVQQMARRSASGSSPVTTLSRPRPGGPFITFRGL
jgi:hypothetical protein